MKITKILAGVSFAMQLTGGAAAQDALGDGTALDANSNNLYGRSNLPTEQIDFNLNNLLITNNVVGGRGFRGTVGYTAANDFRGATGSDQFYSFRADSAISDINLLNLGSTYQRLRYGQGLGLIEYHRVSEGSVFPTPNPFAADAAQNQTLHGLRRDQISFSSQISSEIIRAEEPQNVGYQRDENDALYIIAASPLSGMQSVEARLYTGLMGLSDYDVARLRDDLYDRRAIQPAGKPFEASFKDLEEVRKALAARENQIDPQLHSDPQDTRAADPKVSQTTAQGAPPFASVMNQDYMQIMEKMADIQQQSFALNPNAATSDESDSDLNLSESEVLLGLEEDVRRLREELAKEPGSLPLPDDPTRLPSPTAGSATHPGQSGGTTSGVGTPGSMPTGAYTPPRAASGDASEPTIDMQIPIPVSDLPDAVKDPLKGPYGDMYENVIPPSDSQISNLDMMKSILRHGERIEHLSNQDDSRFGELMKSGEEALRRGDYFWAERRFDRALRFTPGHPLATAGKAHSQLGGQLYVSAALTLRSLFRFQPEMIDVRYDEGLLPNRPRMLDAVQTLEARLEQPRDRANNAFLLAYLGHQLDDRALIEKGLGIMLEELPGEPLPALLKAVWLAPEAPAAEPDTAGETPAAETALPEK